MLIVSFEKKDLKLLTQESDVLPFSPDRLATYLVKMFYNDSEKNG